MACRRSGPRGRAWAEGARIQRTEKTEGIVSATFDLQNLIGRGLLSEKVLKSFTEETGLRNFSWRMFHHERFFRKSTPRREVLKRAQGFVVFMHGWDGSGAVWEDLPAMVCNNAPRLVSLVPDINGFGGSPFELEVPGPSQCDPPACMRAVERWLDILKLKSRPGAKRKKPFTFVGHSMGGAALFYKDEGNWEEREYALCAIAPALLNNDFLRKGFYKALGVGIIAGIQFPLLDGLKETLAPWIIDELSPGASEAVKREHERVFDRTSKGTLAQTFYAMGQAERRPRLRKWDNFKVILAHDDRLVGLSPMLDLLKELGLTAENIRVVLGDHYLFSVGRSTRKTHGVNRQIVLQEILALHERLRGLQSRSRR
jgi:pimeloyl-ACP methyl ester carboxylesterase